MFCVLDKYGFYGTRKTDNYNIVKHLFLNRQRRKEATSFKITFCSRNINLHGFLPC